MKSNSLSVVLVTTDLTGSPEDEEFEGFCLHFAKYLHFDLGHEVTVLATTPMGIAIPRRAKTRFRDACGSAPLDWSDIASGADLPELPRNPFLERSRVVCEWLKTRVFDVCLFGGSLPDAFIPLQAKFTGQAFQQTLLTVIMRGSAERLRQDRHAYADDWLHSLARDYMERYCAEHADLLLSPSQDLFDWATANGWKLASNRRVAPLLQGWREGVPIARDGFDRPAGQEVWHQIHQAAVPAVEAPPKRCPHTPKVSVCVAHFNYGQYLPHALESLRRQTYENFEVIVVDDGSTEPTSQQSFKRMQAQYEPNQWRFHQKKNGFLGQTRNVAARLAVGELLVFMDADNVAAPDMLERMVRARQASQASCLTCHHLAFVSDEARERGDWAFRVNPLGPCLELAIYENMLGDANFIVCRDVFESLGGFSEDRDLGCEDWEFLLKLMVSGFVMDVIPEPLFHYRFQPASMARTMDRYASHQRALRPVLERLDPWQRRFVQNAVGSYWTLRKDLPRLERRRRRRERLAKFKRFWLNWTSAWR